MGRENIRNCCSAGAPKVCSTIDARCHGAPPTTNRTEGEGQGAVGAGHRQRQYVSTRTFCCDGREGAQERRQAAARRTVWCADRSAAFAACSPRRCTASRIVLFRQDAAQDAREPRPDLSRRAGSCRRYRCAWTPCGSPTLVSPRPACPRRCPPPPACKRPTAERGCRLRFRISEISGRFQST